MTKKITLGKRPESFRAPVKFPMLDGSEGAIQCEFKYRTKTEFGKFIDKMVEDAKTTEAKQAPGSEAEEGAGAVRLGDIMAKTVDKNADYLMDVLKGWDIEGRDLTRDNCAMLADELPGAAVAIMEVYRTSVTEGRRGN